MTRLLIMFVVFLTGCGKTPNDIITDQCLRIQLAQQCMQNLPAAPTATMYNDWDEVVAQCDRNASWQSMRHRQYVKPECAI